MSCDPSLPRLLQGDPGRLRQVVLNLAANAVKFTAEGTVGLRALAASQHDGTVAVRLEVSDTGIGIDAADQARIFEPFRQADASTTRQFGGTGLGLAISAQLVGTMGGKIGVVSEPGRGSTFWCTVPLRRGAAVTISPPAADDRLTATAPVDRNRARILLVEDNAVNQLVAAAMLRKIGYTTDIAATGSRRSTPWPDHLRGNPDGLPDAGDGRVRGHRRHPATARLGVAASRSSP